MFTYIASLHEPLCHDKNEYIYDHCPNLMWIDDRLASKNIFWMVCYLP